MVKPVRVLFLDVLSLSRDLHNWSTGFCLNALLKFRMFVKDVEGKFTGCPDVDCSPIAARTDVDCVSGMKVVKDSTFRTFLLERLALWAPGSA